MPQAGERKMKNGITGEWDGSTWRQVDGSAAPSPAGVPGAASMFHPGLGDTPTTAALQELGRTGVETVKGLARSPIDAMKGLFGLATTNPLTTVKNLAHTVANPSEVVNAIGADPSLGGSMIGQLLMGKLLPGQAGNIADATGKGVGSIGGGLTKMGEAGNIPIWQRAMAG